MSRSGCEPLVPRACPGCGSSLIEGRGAGFCAQCLARVSLVPRLFRTAAARGVEAVESPSRGGLTLGGGGKAGLPSQRLGDYDLLEVVAEGGMGVVWRARQRSVGRTVALKLLRLGPWARPAEVDRFRLEAAAVASLQHPHIVSLHEFGEHDGQPWFSMDYIEGRTLADLIREGPMAAGEAAGLLRTVAGAIAYAHGRGILHRDIKPSNVLLDAGGQPWVTDFGLAKRWVGGAAGSWEGASGGGEGRDDLTRSGQMLGTPHYAPPEQLSVNRATVGPPSDVYALGAVLYEMLTGRPPFAGGSMEATLLRVLEAEPVAPRELNPAVPRDLETICLKCLEKDPGRRYATAQALVEELDRLLGGQPVLARPVGRWERCGRWCRRKPGWATAGALALVLAGTVAVLLPRAPGEASGSRIGAGANQSLLGIPVRLQQATATYSQSGYPVAAAVDGEVARGGWAILDRSRPGDPTLPQSAVFETASDIGFPGGSVLRFRLIQNGGGQHCLGRFRLSATTGDRGTFADGLASGGDVTTDWVPLAPSSVHSLSVAGGLIWTKLEDASVLATGLAPHADTYTVVVHTTMTGITGFRLEVLPYSILPFGGPGLRVEDGNFILSELEVDISAVAVIHGSAGGRRLEAERLQLAARYFDTEFAEAHWEMRLFADGPSVRAGQRQVTEGRSLGGALHRTSHYLGGSVSGSEVLTVHLNRGAVYDPAAQGGIAAVEWGLDARVFATERNTFGGSVAPAVEQGGRLFVANRVFQPAREDQESRRLPSPWKELRFRALGAVDFHRVVDFGRIEEGEHPDFSDGGVPLVFGFAQRNSHTSIEAVLRETDVDNWTVAVYGLSAGEGP